MMKTCIPTGQPGCAVFLARQIQGAIFDLDGVIVDTARYHFQAWQQLAAYLGFALPDAVNEQLKGVSRQESLEIVLQCGGISLGDEEKKQLAAMKNEWYVACLKQLTSDAILPGVPAYLGWLRGQGIRIALGSASKNAGLILNRLGLAEAFDVIVDGTAETPAKPDPGIFLLAAAKLGIAPEHCMVFEDSAAGIQAARTAGMLAVGVGEAFNLTAADLVIRGFDKLIA